LSVDDFKEQNKCFLLEKKSNLPVGFVPVVIVPGLVHPMDSEVVSVTKVTEVVSTLCLLYIIK
jgi:hypothetical protein